MSVQSVLTDITNNTAKVQAEQAVSRRGQSEMDQQAFLQLLMAQLKYQDPLNPVKNTEFISQQAQLTQVSEMQKLNQTNTFAQASALIGREVTLNDPENPGTTVTGIVTGAKFSDKGTDVIINEKQYPSKAITDVKMAPIQNQ